MTELERLFLELKTAFKQSSTSPLKNADFLRLAKQTFSQLENMPLEESQTYLTEINQVVMLMREYFEKLPCE